MQSAIKSNQSLSFLLGGGEMGARTRSFDWSTTSIGTPEYWPQSLRTTVGILFNSSFPMCLFWGPDLICFYNDAYLLALGDEGKHPKAPGQRGEDCCTEMWSVFKPTIDQVKQGDGATSADYFLPIYRNGKLEDRYWTFSYSPVIAENGNAEGVLVVCNETTEKVTAQLIAKRTPEESENLWKGLIDASPVRTLLITGKDMIVELANEQVLRSWGKDRSVIGRPLREIIPEDQYNIFHDLLEDVYTSGLPFIGKDTPVKWEGADAPGMHYVDFTYQPVKNAAGEIYGVLSTAIEVTEKVLARKAIKESEQNLRNVILQAPIAMCILRGEQFAVEIANTRMYELWGRSEAELVNQPLFKVLPEASGQGFEDLLNKVYTTGESFSAYGTPVNLPRDGNVETVYINFLYEPFRDANGVIAGVMAVASDVTAQVLAGKKVEESEQNLRSLVESAPFPIGVYVGRDMRIQLVNQSIKDVWGKGDHLIGKTYSEVLPELENQEIYEQLDDVYTSGIAFHAKNQRVDLVIGGKLQPYYFNYSFTPLYDASGAVYGVMNTAADITDLVLANKQVEEAEASLRSAIELAELGTWSADLRTRTLQFSERLCNWSGFDTCEPITIEEAFGPIPQQFLVAIREAGIRAIDPESDGLFDVEYAVVNQKTGKEHILHAQGKAFLDEEGKPYKFSGTAQDITKQRKLQHELEQQVQQRTTELRTANTALEEANNQLQHSNDELAQYAYVASHDLQEPLRKIRIFAGILDKQQDLTAHSRQLIGKIDAASERLVMLIKDLLEFSRLLNSDALLRPVDLNEVCRAVISDFEINISEKKAKVNIGNLPVVNAVALQMNQLFYNLLSNALKFTKPEVVPIIYISAVTLTKDEVRKYITKPDLLSTYYDIVIRDNGIGFDAAYADQIFEVFKRLNGRDIYPGSGIGLALCRRIAANQKGHLYAESRPDEGATFHIILPDRLSDLENIPG